MKKVLLLTIVLLPLLSCTQEKNTDDTTVYYFIRHAEKDRSDPQNKNPELTDKGRERAKKWAAVFKNITFDAVYSTDYNRTRQTATPTAAQNNVDLIMYNPREFDSNAFKNRTKGKTVLIVGHSNTTPMLVNLISGTKKYPDIEDNNNANLYIVTITNNKATDILLKIE